MFGTECVCVCVCVCGIGKEGVCLHSRSRQGECWYRTEWGKSIYLTPQLWWGGGEKGERGGKLGVHRKRERYRVS